LATMGIWTSEIIKRSDRAKGLVVLPRRWVVERIFAWLNQSRPPAEDFEACIETATAWLFATNVKLLIGRMARS
jgi:putative transposase